jgi:ankyrin repeat protein
MLLLLCVVLEWCLLSPLPAPAITGIDQMPLAASAPMTPDQRLYAAIVGDDQAKAEAALRDGADVNKRYFESQDTPLLMATGWGYDPDMIALLLQHHADPNLRDRYGESPLHFAVKGAGYNLDEQRKLGFKAAEQLGEAHRYRMMQLLLEAGADPNARDQHDHTPLHLLEGDRSVGRLLLLARYHADMNARDDHRQTALHYFAPGHSPAMVRALLRLHADPNVRDDQGRTPLMCVNPWEEETYRALLEGGANVHLRDREGRTALLQLFEQAAQSHNKGFTDNEGESHPENVSPPDERVVRLLLRHGAHVNVADRKGTTPLQWAKQLAAECVERENRRKTMAMVRLLEQAGAKEPVVNSQEMRGQSAKLQGEPMTVRATDGEEIWRRCVWR